MPTNEWKRAIRRDLAIAAALTAAGLTISGFSLADLEAQGQLHMAQATPGTPALKGTPAPEKDNKPAEPKPGGTRPTTPAPEPARPDPQAQKEGAKPALPPAPAEKIAPPLNPPAKPQ
jgi:hypothetical protein